MLGRSSNGTSMFAKVRQGKASEARRDRFHAPVTFEHSLHSALTRYMIRTASRHVAYASWTARVVRKWLGIISSSHPRSIELFSARAR